MTSWSFILVSTEQQNLKVLLPENDARASATQGVLSTSPWQLPQTRRSIRKAQVDYRNPSLGEAVSLGVAGTVIIRNRL